MSDETATTTDQNQVKLGLALSGGGFRAAFFHIGVLARMAELGLLRKVEVISTVSGGSILGALYYLHVKRLLETKQDAEVNDNDYVEIVKTIEKDFFAGVSRNLRARTFARLRSNFHMSSPRYSRSDRIGELYDECFYRDFRNQAGERIRMRDLRIGAFDPKHDNPRREAKVPILLLNATVLNDGHAWRFEAVRMGEPPQPAPASRIDKNMVLRRAPDYGDMTPVQQDFHLGVAVAASACFPAFPPLAISDLYPDQIRVQLVDGGVYDNQGVQGLYDSGCTHLVVSDGSGQMRDEPQPPGSIVGALFRESSIQADRIRDVQLLWIDNNPNAAVVHLRTGLVPRDVPWIGQGGNPVPPPPGEGPDLLPFGVRCTVQDLLSRVRTDLDSFSEIESSSLMCDAYMMSGQVLPSAEGIARLVNPIGPRPGRPPWGFLAISPWLSDPTPDSRFRKHVRVASSRFFKAAMLNRWLWLLLALPLGALGALVWWLWDPVLTAHMAVGWIVLALVALPLIVSLPRLIYSIPLLRALAGPLEAMVRRTLWIALPFVPWLFVRVHLATSDRWFRKGGAISMLAPPD